MCIRSGPFAAIPSRPTLVVVRKGISHEALSRCQLRIVSWKTWVGAMWD